MGLEGFVLLRLGGDQGVEATQAGDDAPEGVAQLFLIGVGHMQNEGQTVTTEERWLSESWNFVFWEKIKTSSPILLDVECCNL